MSAGRGHSRSVCGRQLRSFCGLEGRTGFNSQLRQGQARERVCTTTQNTQKSMMINYKMAQIRHRIQCNSRAPQGLTNSSHGRKPVESGPHNHLKNRPRRGRPRMCFGLQDWATPSGSGPLYEGLLTVGSIPRPGLPLGRAVRGYDGSWEYVTVF